MQREERLENIPSRLEEDLETLRAWVEGNIMGGSEEKWALLQSYVHVLYHASVKLNLVSLQEREFIATRHVWRALAMVPHVQQVPHETLIDIGSGSGIPAIPLKIWLPDTSIYLVESRRRRANFLKQAVRTLGLKNATVVNERVEEWKASVVADVITARAVASPRKLKAWVQPHAHPSAWLFCTLDPCGESVLEEAERVVVRWKNESMHLGRVPLNY